MENYKLLIFASAIYMANRNRTPERNTDIDETLNYWQKEFPQYSERTSSSILAVLMSRLSGLLHSPYR
jgi:hypothetical protein